MVTQRTPRTLVCHRDLNTGNISTRLFHLLCKIEKKKKKRTQSTAPIKTPTEGPHGVKVSSSSYKDWVISWSTCCAVDSSGFPLLRVCLCIADQQRNWMVEKGCLTKQGLMPKQGRKTLMALYDPNQLISRKVKLSQISKQTD